MDASRERVLDSRSKEKEALSKDKASQLEDNAKDIARLLAQVDGQKKHRV